MADQPNSQQPMAVQLMDSDDNRPFVWDVISGLPLPESLPPHPRPYERLLEAVKLHIGTVVTSLKHARKAASRRLLGRHKPRRPKQLPRKQIYTAARYLVEVFGDRVPQQVLDAIDESSRERERTIPGSDTTIASPGSPSDEAMMDDHKYRVEMLEKGEFSDFTVKCKTRTWAVHRIMLCKNRFFRAACGSQFQEASIGEINLSDDDEQGVQIMLYFIYTMRIDMTVMTTSAYMQMFLIGDKYDLVDVRNTGLHHLKQEIEHHVKEPEWTVEWYPIYSTLWHSDAEMLRSNFLVAIAENLQALMSDDAFSKMYYDDDNELR